MNHLSTFGTKQNGFRKFKSTETNLIVFYFYLIDIVNYRYTDAYINVMEIVI